MIDHMEGLGLDRISGLPDDLLQEILLRLSSLPAAARTSLLSRRWRRVWTGLPELVLAGFHAPSTFLRAVNGTLAAYSAPTVSSLTITVPEVEGFHVPYCPAAAWLRFASRRVAGTFSLTLTNFPSIVTVNALKLPPCGRATSITLSLDWFTLRLRPLGSFAALTVLTIQWAVVDIQELGELISSMCPRLTDLTLRVQPLTDRAVSVCSASLKRLKFQFNESACPLEVVAPVLEVLVLGSTFIQAHISAPKLTEANVPGLNRCHFADDVPRRLRRLQTTRYYGDGTPPLSPLKMRRFDAVDELRLRVCIEVEGYSNFLDDLDKLPMCETLSANVTGRHYGYFPSMPLLLRMRNSLRKLVLEKQEMKNICLLDCPCRLTASHQVDNSTLDSLEEIEISSFKGTDDHVEFLKLLLSKCSPTKLINVKINIYILHL
ncbi:hypothetical protein QYE76_046139 [Lolium multiflorum]|uniref:F-box domain-containing protein n=1 Tax=Lolium multiflorum TaxID=4521 RepID=A0AAD8X0F1_LOLMU|nr:hypothetical protein QYE76_046139 [Lolium multiflorum]